MDRLCPHPKTVMHSDCFAGRPYRERALPRMGPTANGPYHERTLPKVCRGALRASTIAHHAAWSCTMWRILPQAIVQLDRACHV
jgi:hypothetical protein